MLQRNVLLHELINVISSYFRKIAHQIKINK